MLLLVCFVSYYFNEGEKGKTDFVFLDIVVGELLAQWVRILRQKVFHFFILLRARPR